VARKLRKGRSERPEADCSARTDRVVEVPHGRSADDHVRARRPASSAAAMPSYGTSGARKGGTEAARGRRDWARPNEARRRIGPAAARAPSGPAKTSALPARQPDREAAERVGEDSTRAVHGAEGGGTRARRPGCSRPRSRTRSRPDVRASVVWESAGRSAKRSTSQASPAGTTAGTCTGPRRFNLSTPGGQVCRDRSECAMSRQSRRTTAMTWSAPSTRNGAAPGSRAGRWTGSAAPRPRWPPAAARRSRCRRRSWSAVTDEGQMRSGPRGLHTRRAVRRHRPEAGAPPTRSGRAVKLNPCGQLAPHRVWICYCRNARPRRVSKSEKLTQPAHRGNDPRRGRRGVRGIRLRGGRAIGSRSRGAQSTGSGDERRS